MKSIEVLIKIKKKELDEKRLEIASLEKQKDEILAYSEKMKNELKAEEELAAREPSMAITFDNYRIKIKERQGNISHAVKDIGRQISVLNSSMADIFTEMKKYEIILSRKIEEKSLKEKSEDEKTLNEVAMNNHLQKLTD